LTDIDRDAGAAAIRDLTFDPAPRGPDGVHAKSLEDTHAALVGIARHVPITRVSDLTPLNRLGIPAYSAVTPLARDLTVHAGKGPTKLAAKVSAMMEAIERISAERISPARTTRHSYEQMRQITEYEVLPPERLNLPFETAYVPDVPIDWILGIDLCHNRPTWVACDAVVSPAYDHVLSGTETNGLASGNSFTEAALHGLYELIERDAASIATFIHRHCEAADRPPRLRPIAPAGLDPVSLEWLGRLEREKIEVMAFDISSDIDVPVVEVRLYDPNFQGSGRAISFVGHGCSLDRRHAYSRAILEAAQAYSVLVAGSRETYDAATAGLERSFSLSREAERRFTVTPALWSLTSAASSDLLCDLHTVVALLVAQGLERCIVIDLTRRDIGIPVVRVIVPGLECPYGFTTRRPGRRLLEQLTH
jgi:YcaO-like protein with predicted kinase domain